MTASQAIVPYRPGPSSTLATRSPSLSLIPSNFFTQQTGTAIATELLYRLLYDIINRLLGSIHRLASKGFEECSSFIEQKLQERRDRLAVAKSNAAAGGSKIVEEVGRLVVEGGFITCPMTGREFEGMGKRGVPGPPPWARGVLEGIDEGRMHERDFWIQTHEG